MKKPIINKTAQTAPPPAFKPKGKADRSVLEPKAAVPPTAKSAPSNKGKFGLPPGVKPEAASHGAQPATSVRPNIGVPAVKEMQQAILDFAQVAASTDVTSMKGNQFGKQEGNQSRSVHTTTNNKRPNPDFDPSRPEDETNESFIESGANVDLGGKEQLGGSDPFGDFIVQQYVANDPAGTQYLNTDVSGKKNRGDASIDNSNLRGLIDSISRVGTPGVNGGEKSVDGVWAYRTDHALKGISLLTKAMLDFARDLKVPVHYTDENFNSFVSQIPKQYTELKDPAAKSAKAKFLTSHINAISGFFKELKKSILNNREHREYIDQKKPFVQYKKLSKKSPKEILGKEEFTTFTTKQLYPIPQVNFVGVNEKNNSISLSELADMDSFKKFMNRIGKGKEAENPAEVKKMLDLVQQQLDGSASGV